MLIFAASLAEASKTGCKRENCTELTRLMLSVIDGVYER